MHLDFSFRKFVTKKFKKLPNLVTLPTKYKLSFLLLLLLRKVKDQILQKTVSCISSLHFLN